MKLRGWGPRFDAYIESVRNESFVWGEFDCAILSAAVTDIVQGREAGKAEDIIRSAFGSVRTAEDYIRFLEKEGPLGVLVNEYFADRVTQSPVAMCGKGDIVLLNLEGREMLAPHDGTMALAPGTNGLNPIDLSYAKMGWVT